MDSLYTCKQSRGCWSTVTLRYCIITVAGCDIWRLQLCHQTLLFTLLITVLFLEKGVCAHPAECHMPFNASSSVTWWPPGRAPCSWTPHKAPGTFPSPLGCWKALGFSQQCLPLSPPQSAVQGGGGTQPMSMCLCQDHHLAELKPWSKIVLPPHGFCPQLIQLEAAGEPRLPAGWRSHSGRSWCWHCHAGRRSQACRWWADYGCRTGSPEGKNRDRRRKMKILQVTS